MAPSIAIIGGGIAGTTALHVLSTQFPGLRATLFDQGQRGVGGRTSHRRVDHSGSIVNDETLLSPMDAHLYDSFDHGCQFFFATTSRFQVLLV